MWYFVWFVSSTQIEIFPQMEINDRKSLENFLKNIYGGVCFNKIASLCSTKSNSTITRLHYRLFAEYVQKNCISSSTTEVSPRGFWERALYKIWKEFLQDVYVIPYWTKLQTYNL